MAGKKFKPTRTETDTLGRVNVPRDAYWGAQTQRAIENFPPCGMKFPPVLFHALGYIKLACAMVNADIGLLDKRLAGAIIRASGMVARGRLDDQFPVGIFQTGSGTSTNMNANEVIATRANEILSGRKMRNTKHPVHPNDHVNMGQSSNDVIPSAIHLASLILLNERLLPSLTRLQKSLKKKSALLKSVVKTGRTHLMDAMPITMGQEISGWAAQVEYCIRRTRSTVPRLSELAIGGTAVGTGINAHPEFGKRVSKALSELTGIRLREARNHFQAQASQETVLELSGMLKTTASAFMKIANDLRLMASGPASGLNEIRLKTLQPGSSIMPGKVNPVLPEAVRMMGAQVMGNDLAIAIAGSMGEFELNAMLPVIANGILQSITLISNAALLLARTVDGFEVNTEHIANTLGDNPVIAAVLNPVIGYDTAAIVVRKALESGRPVKEVVVEMGYLGKKEAEKILDPEAMTHSGRAMGKRQGARKS
ncbi:MAG: class II fumarate hydratase [Nitrospiraceae bacterium]|nr:class II fumarate hydratase [Nitrospiraceae bacterium]